MTKQVSKQTNSDKGSSIGMPVVIGGLFLIGGATWLVYNAIQDKKQQDTSGALQTDENVRQATEIYNIIDASGYNHWYELKRYEVLAQVVDYAKKIKDWKAVSSAYQTLYTEDLTKKLNDLLIPSDYAAFLANLQVKGKPQNGSGTTIITPNLPSASGFNIGDSVFLNWLNKASINMYSNSTDYPQKPIVISKPSVISSTPFGKIIRIDNIAYTGSSVKMPLAQVQLTGKTNKLWIRVVDLSKSKVLGNANGGDASYHLSIAI